MRNLCIDIGNTLIKWAVFEQPTIVHKQGAVQRLSTTKLKKWIKKYQIENVILSSVRRGNKRWRRWLKRRFAERFLFLTPPTPLPLQLCYATPLTLGRDRIASAVGARALFPNQNLLVIDAGTCITCNFTDAQGNYHGGSIAPGLSMRLQALQHFTARLPLVTPLAEWTEFIGNSTENSIRAGVQWGIIHEVDGFIDQYRQKVGDLQVLLTGGSATYFETRLKNKIFVAPDLVRIGLNQILNYNVLKTFSRL